jgi:Fe(3+) dicitrate transport protein
MRRVESWIILVLFAALLILCLSDEAAARTPDGRIEGHVFSEETGRPLAGAAVYLIRDGTARHTGTTNQEGYFRFSGVEAGSATLRIRFIGYRRYEEPIEITADQTRSVQVELAAAPVTLTEIDIIGRRTLVDQQLAGTASRLLPRDVEEIDAIGTQELVTRAPGVYGVVDDGMGNSRISVGIRGLEPRRTERVLVLEDGIPIQPAPYVFAPMYYNPPSERIAEVEVLKSSGAIKHGPQTMGGVINYITSRPRQTFGGSMQVTTGMNGFASLFGELQGWGSETVIPEVQLLLKRGDGFRENNDFKQFNGTFKLNILPDTSRALYVKGNVNFERTNATYSGLTPYSFHADPTFNPKPHDIYEVFRTSLDLIYDTEISGRLNGTTKAYFNRFHRPWWREKDVFVRASEYDPDRPEDINPVPWYTSGNLIRVGGGEENAGNIRTFYVAGLEQRYRFDHRAFGGSARLEAGARVHWERFMDNRKVGDAPGVRDGVYFTGDPDDPSTLTIVGQSHHYETTALALHALENISLGPFRVEPGVRVEVFEQERINRLQDSRYRDKTSAVLLPGFGVNYRFGSFNVFGGIHRGYTPPSSATLKIVNFEADRDTGEGLDLRSEKSWNSEAGLRGQLPWVEFETAAFHLYIEDLVGGRTVFQNLGRVQNYGLELSGSLRGSRLAPFLPDLNVSYTYLQTEILQGRINSAQKAGNVEVDISGNELPHAPRHTLTAGIDRELPFGLSLRLDMRRASRMYTDLENIEETSNRGDMGPVPGYTIFDASTAYELPRGLSLRVTAKNLFDRVYIGSRLHSNPGQPQAHMSSGILPGPRRQINVTLQYAF